MLDSTDVNLWYKIGHVALRLIRVPLARHAFEEGLRCNPDHWPCLDNLITVLYTLSDYTSELDFVAFSRVFGMGEGGLGKLEVKVNTEGPFTQLSRRMEMFLHSCFILFAFLN